MDLKQLIQYIPNFPIEGVLFRDLTKLWSDPNGLKQSTDQLCLLIEQYKPTKLVAMESRGFIIASSMAYKMGIGLTLIRKEGKLPPPTVREEYNNEYSEKGIIEIKMDDLKKDDRIIFVDDILATGKSAFHAKNLIKKVTGQYPLACLFLLSIESLNGIDKIKDTPVISLIKDTD